MRYIPRPVAHHRRLAQLVMEHRLPQRAEHLGVCERSIASPLRTTRLATQIQQGRRNSRSELPSYRHSRSETSVAATGQLLGWERYAFDERRRLDKRGHLDALVIKVNSKIKRTVSDVPSRDHAIFNP
jgi:hypothetical protein